MNYTITNKSQKWNFYKKESTTFFELNQSPGQSTGIIELPTFFIYRAKNKELL